MQPALDYWSYKESGESPELNRKRKYECGCKCKPIPGVFFMYSLPMFSSRLVEPSRHGTDQATNRDYSSTRPISLAEWIASFPWNQRIAEGQQYSTASNLAV
jgi:hypothetical protein